MTQTSRRRVVVTGLGVIAPNGNGIRAFEDALRQGRSGIRYMPVMEEAKFGCRVAGAPQGVDELAAERFAQDELLAMNMSHRYSSLRCSRRGRTPASSGPPATARPWTGTPEPSWAPGSEAWTRRPRRWSR